MITQTFQETVNPQKETKVTYKVISCDPVENGYWVIAEAVEAVVLSTNFVLNIGSIPDNAIIDAVSFVYSIQAWASQTSITVHDIPTTGGDLNERIREYLSGSPKPNELRFTAYSINRQGATLSYRTGHKREIGDEVYGAIDLYKVSVSLSVNYEEVEEPASLSYGTNNQWQKCIPYYGVNGQWQKCKAYYGINGAWQECK